MQIPAESRKREERILSFNLLEEHNTLTALVLDQWETF